MINLEINTKECNICKVVKPLLEFYTQNKNRKDGSQWIYYNPECKECTKKRSSKWINNNKEKYLNVFVKEQNRKRKEIKKLHRQDNLETYQNNVREWQRSHKDKISEYNEDRKLNKTHDINKREWEACKQYFNYSCAYCGINEQEAKVIYNNYLHKEHVIHNGANDLSNCVPACKVCNSSKHDSNLDDWYNATNDNYTNERIDKILKWLTKDYLKYIKQ